MQNRAETALLVDPAQESTCLKVRGQPVAHADR
jgi:hypothetical protein